MITPASRSAVRFECSATLTTQVAGESTIVCEPPGWPLGEQKKFGGFIAELVLRL
jgi:hypothetical protein